MVPVRNDHVHDVNHQELYKLSQLVEFPDFVKTASLATMEDVESLPGDAFIDPVTRRFPVHTKADAWVSSQFITKLGAADTRNTEIAGALDAALKFWKLGCEANAACLCPGDIEGKTETESVKVSDTENGEDLKDEYPAQSYIKDMDGEGDDGKDPQKFPVNKDASAIIFRDDKKSYFQVPVRNQDDFDKVANHILEDPKKTTYAVRRNVAEQLQKLAAEKNYTMDLATDVLLQKTAGMGVGTVGRAHEVLDARIAVSRIANPDCLSSLQNMKDYVEKIGSASHDILPPDVLEKVAGLADAVDRLTGCHRTWGQDYQVPERQLFETTVRHLDSFKSAAVKLRGGKYASRTLVTDPRTKAFVRDTLGLRFGDEQDYLNKIASRITLNQSNAIQDYLAEIQE